MRRWWRSAPEKGVASQVSTISRASSKEVAGIGSKVCPPERQRTLASLCSRDILALVVDQTATARIPFTLLAAMQIPSAEPQKRIPLAEESPVTLSDTALA